MTVPSSVLPDQMNAETVDPSRYYSLDELAAMPAPALEELWQSCPEKPFYETALEEAVLGEFGMDQMITDLERLTVIDKSIGYYRGDPPRIPVLQAANQIRWFKVPRRITRHLEEGAPLVAEQKASRAASLPRPVLIGGFAGLLLTACIAVIVITKVAAAPRATRAELTATAAFASTQQALQPAITPSATPLALDDIDRPIQEGEDLRNRFPVILEIQPASGSPRVFPVQQKEVELAEWHYASDPDVASSILGLAVRPVLGIAYSPANQQFLEALVPGDRIVLRMSTGQSLLFNVTHSERVERQQVSLFDQTSPGIAVVLLGDPGADRLVVYGEYLQGQELARGDAALTGMDTAPVSPQQAVPLGDSGVTLTVLDAYSSVGPSGAELPAEWLYLLVDVQIAADREFPTRNIVFILTDQSGSEYRPAAVDPTITQQGAFNAPLLAAGQEVSTTLGFLVPRSISSAALMAQAAPGAAAVRYSLPYAPLSALTASDLDALVLGIEMHGSPDQPEWLAVRVRLFNPNDQAITLRPGDIYAVFSPVVVNGSFPIGPQVSPADAPLPLTLRRGEAQDIELRFAWAGEPYVGISIGGYRIAAVLYEGGG